MKRHYIILVTVFLALAVLFIASWLFLPIQPFPDQDSSFGNGITQYAVWSEDGHCFRLDVADTNTLRLQGLSGRDSLAYDEGMLFLYDLSGEYGYWMKGMNFPIDIIWLDRNDVIVTAMSSVSPKSYPEIFYPSSSARKIIEVSAGVVKDLNLKEGDQLNVSSPTSTPIGDCAML